MNIEAALEELELEIGATFNEVRIAYRELIKVWHPDRFSLDPKLQERALKKTKRLNEAYTYLSDINTDPTFRFEGHSSRSSKADKNNVGEKPQSRRTAGREGSESETRDAEQEKSGRPATNDSRNKGGMSGKPGEEVLLYEQVAQFETALLPPESGRLLSPDGSRLIFTSKTIENRNSPGFVLLDLKGREIAKPWGRMHSWLESPYFITTESSSNRGERWGLWSLDGTEILSRLGIWSGSVERGNWLVASSANEPKTKFILNTEARTEIPLPDEALISNGMVVTSKPNLFGRATYFLWRPKSGSDLPLTCEKTFQLSGQLEILMPTRNLAVTTTGGESLIWNLDGKNTVKIPGVYPCLSSDCKFISTRENRLFGGCKLWTIEGTNIGAFSSGGKFSADSRLFLSGADQTFTILELSTSRIISEIKGDPYKQSASIVADKFVFVMGPTEFFVYDLVGRLLQSKTEDPPIYPSNFELSDDGFTLVRRYGTHNRSKIAVYKGAISVQV